MTPSFFLALPTYNEHIHIGTALAVIQAATSGGISYEVHAQNGSVLPSVFNKLWADAIAGDFDYFVMLHADIIPEGAWLETLYREMRRLDADVVSCVVPMKHDSGATSTAIERLDGRELRLTLEACQQLPTTFHRQDVADAFSTDDDHHFGALLINTGCWIANLRRDWVRQVSFHFFDAIHWTGDRTYEVQCSSEDWNLSRDLHRLGVSGVYATTAVKLSHVGRAHFRNTSDPPPRSGL